MSFRDKSRARVILSEAKDPWPQESGSFAALRMTALGFGMTRFDGTAFAGAAFAVLAGALAVRLIPPPGGTAEAGLNGLPRLLVYLIGGLALGLTGAQCTPKLAAAWRVRRSSDIALALGLVLSIAIILVDVLRLRRDIADPLGPPLWFAAMLTLLSAAVAASSPFRLQLGRPAWPWLALGALLAFGALIRFVALDTIPLGINPDEGDRASTALDVLDGSAPRALFDSGWFFINMVYFRLLALSLSVFGPDIAGGRTGSAIVGTAFLCGLAWLACRQFGWRIGLVAVSLATASALSLQHSRLIAETIPTALLWVISIGGFVEGARTGRPWAFAVAGLGGGLSLYFYPSARLWAVGALATVAIIWLLTRRGRAGVLLRGFTVAGVACLVAAAPFLVHLQTHPIEVTGRYAQTAVLDPHNQERLSYLAPPEPLARLVLLQAERTLGMFDRYSDGGGFLPTGQPIFAPPLSALALLAMVFGLVRGVRDVRLAILSVWLSIGLSGVFLTVETPDMIRAVGALPSVFVLMAIVLVELIDRLLDAAHHVRPSGARPAFAWAVPFAVALLVLGTDTAGYFGTFKALPAGWGPMTREGLAVAQLGQTGPVYSLETNEHMVTSGWVRLLAPNAERGRIPNPGRELPILAPLSPADMRPQMTPAIGQAMNFLLSADPNQRVYQDLLYLLYPGGWLDDAGDGRRSYTISPEALAEARGVRVSAADGSSWPVDRFGQLPQGASQPNSLTWSGGVLLAHSGEHRFQVLGPARLRVDGVPVVERVLAARGVHFIELESTTSDAAQSIALLLDGQEPGPRETYRLMDAPWGLLARVARPLSGSLPEPANGVLDATVAMAFFDPELGPVPAPNSIVWSGTLAAPSSGIYRMAFAAEDPMRFELDSQPVDVVTVGPERWVGVGPGSLVRLNEGPHTVRVTLQVTHGGRDLARWNWVPPRPDGTVAAQGTWAVVPPTVLRPDPPVRALN
jgi:Dolichyl-phosphate-mannose-protein mannosyltransferase